MALTAGGRVHAGFAAVEITPPMGTHLAGSGAGIHRPAQTVLDPLYARAAVFSSGETTLCLTEVDAAIISSEYAEKIASGVMQARRGIRHGLAFNRRAISRVTENAEDTELSYKVGLSLEKGKVIMPFPMDNTALKNPVGPDYISHLEGPTDDEVLAACFIDEQMQIESLLLHFTCHPVNAYCNDATYYAVSADWPGTWAQAAAERLHTKRLPLVINGCCGNSNPIDPYQPDQVLEPEKMGGELAIVALPGEPFAEGRLDVKLRSPAPLTIVGHMANKYVGYIPTKAACAAGGLEAHPMHVYWSKLEPDALQKITDKSVELLNELYAD